MNPLAKALDDIKFSIPIQVLNEAFKDQRPTWRQAPFSLDERILNDIIRPRVLIDANLVGGQTILVPLDGVVPEYIDGYNSIYRIPKNLTQNRTIMSVMSIGYMPFSSGYAGGAGSAFGSISPGSMNEITGAAQRVGDAASGFPSVSNATATLIGENTVLVWNQFRVTSTFVLRCVVGNEENLNNISPRSFHVFGRLCEYAVKSYIYNTLIIKIDQAYLQGGQELGAFKNYIESLADSEENYRTHLKEVWQAVAFMNDTPAYDRFLKLMVSPGV